MADEQTTTPAEVKQSPSAAALEDAAKLFAAAVQVDGGQPKPMPDDDDDAAPTAAPDGEPPPPAEQPSPASASTTQEPTKREPASSQQAALRRRERAMRQRQAAVEQQAQTIAERAKAAEAALAELDGDEAAVLAAVARRKGVTVASLLRRGAAIIAGQPPPAPEKAQKDGEIASLKQRLDAYEQREREAQEQSINQQWMGTVAQRTRDAAVYPFLSALPPETVGKSALQVFAMYAEKTGVAPDYEAVLEYLESQESERFTAHETARKARSNPAGRNGPGGSPKPAPGSSAERAPSRTVTNEAAAAPTQSRRKLADHEILEHAAELFRPRD